MYLSLWTSVHTATVLSIWLMGTYKSTEQNKCGCVSTGQVLRLANGGAGNFSCRHAVFSCCLLPSLPQDFITNPNGQHRRCLLPVFSLWVEERLLMRQGSARICLMTRKADSSICTLPVLAQATPSLPPSHTASLQQELPTDPHVDPGTPRLVMVGCRFCCLCCRTGVFACWAVACRPLLSLEIWPPVWNRDSLFSERRVLFYFSHGCQKRLGGGEDLLLAYLSIIIKAWNLIFSSLFLSG